MELNSEPMFQVGDHVLYPEYGTGKVVDIDDMVRFEEPMAFYLIKMDETEMKYMVPVGGENTVGLRLANGAKAAHKSVASQQTDLHSKNHEKHPSADVAL